jgi:amphi-Trp domain-containing protein
VVESTLLLMSGLKVEQKQSLSRAEAAKLVADLAEGLKGDGEVTLKLGSGTVELTVGPQLRCELEVEADGEKFELELELKWSSSNGGPTSKDDDDEADDEAADEESADSSKRVPPQNRRSPQERRPAQK